MLERQWREQEAALEASHADEDDEGVSSDEDPEPEEPEEPEELEEPEEQAKAKHAKALEVAAKLAGGDNSWFVKVLTDAKHIEAMASVRSLRSQASPLATLQTGTFAEPTPLRSGCAGQERRG